MPEARARCKQICAQGLGECPRIARALIWVRYFGDAALGMPHRLAGPLLGSIHEGLISSRKVHKEIRRQRSGLVWHGLV